MKECLFVWNQKEQVSEKEDDDDFEDEEGETKKDGVPSYVNLGCSMLPLVN